MIVFVGTYEYRSLRVLATTHAGRGRGGSVKRARHKLGEEGQASHLRVAQPLVYEDECERITSTRVRVCIRTEGWEVE